MKPIFLLRIISPIFFSLILVLESREASAQWIQTGGPPGVTVKAFYQKGTTLYAGTSAKGVFKSTDNGVTWAAANSGIENNDVFSFLAEGIYLYAGTNNGPYRSSDNGITWSPANNGMEGQFVISFIKANGYVFAGTVSFGLFKSNDHGNTWTDANGGALGSSGIHALAFSSPNLIAMADNLIFYSTDNGNSWFIPQNSPFLFSNSVSFVVKQDSVMINTLQGVFRSFNKGQAWDPIIVIDESISICGLVRSGNRINAGSASKIYYTTNFGTSWTLVNSHGLRIGTRFNNAFYKSGGNFLLAFDEIGVAYSSDKAHHWQYTLSGFSPASSIDNAMIFSGTTLYTGTHSDGVYQSPDNGNTWSKIGTPDDADTLSNGIIFSLLKKGNIIIAGTCGFGLYRSANNGITWTHITTGLPTQIGTGFFCVFSLAKCGTNIIAATDQGLYYSTNNGLSWNSSNITGSSSIAVGVAANGSVACATVESTTGPGNIYRSTNSGVTWTSVFQTFFEDFTCIASDGSSHFYAGTFTNNYLSNNNGIDWQSFGPGMPTGSGAFAIAVLNSNVFAGNSQGVFFSNNNGSSFSDAGTGLDPDPNHSVQGFTISSNNIFAGLFQNAIWKRPLSEFGITKESAADAGEINNINARILPNPVGKEATLEYELEKPAHVIVTIYDGLGKLTEQIVNTNLESGYHSQLINSKDLQNGTYAAVISIDGKVFTVKFEVAKQ